ncbi:hypothetical protein HanIR_Chr05g0238871 [Helianthus annuus]|nr:hypothetical protein HanIR_Chr05g0238871 [Helianthus annuus]
MVRPARQPSSLPGPGGSSYHNWPQIEIPLSRLWHALMTFQTAQNKENICSQHYCSVNEYI